MKRTKLNATIYKTPGQSLKRLKNQSDSSKFRFFQKIFFERAFVILLIFSLLAVSTPAAPEAVAAGSGELYRSARFGILSSGLAIDFPNNFWGFFISKKRRSTSEQISKLKVYPGDVTVQQFEQIAFSAVAYDSDDTPINSVAFEWSVAELGHTARLLPHGAFKAQFAGTFTITVEGGGSQAQATVTVNPAPSGNQNNISNDVPGKISTRSEASPKTNKNAARKQKEESSKNETGEAGNNQNLQPGEGEWNSGNWTSADDPGNLPGSPTGSPLDEGANNSNFQIVAPVISLPGRGIDLALNLHYNSRLWNKSGNELTYDIDRGFPAPGWSLGFGKIIDMGWDGGGMLVDADGTRHPYTGLRFPGTGQFNFRNHTTDGKFIDYATFHNSNGLYAADGYFPNGTLITYGAPGDGAVYPTRIRDIQGNYIVITYRNNQGPAIQNITDTTGRVITFNYDSSTPSRLLSVTAPSMRDEDPIYGAGKTRTLLKLHYKSLALSYSFASGITPMVRNGSPQVIDSIYYPATNTGYWFGDTDSYSTYGMISKVVEQRGMSWSTGTEEQGAVTAGTMSKQAVYNYPLTTSNDPDRTNGTGLTNAPNYTKLSESWAERDVNEDAVTTYLYDNNVTRWDGFNNSPARLVQVVQPNGAISRQYSHRVANSWKDGLVFADETAVIENNVEKIVSSSLVNWEQGDYQSPRPKWAEITDERGNKVKTEYDYTNGLFNQITRSCDYDNGGQKLRCSVASYENSQNYKGTWTSVNTGTSVEWYFSGGRHLFNLILTTAIENPDGSMASRTDYEYDNYQNNQLISTPGVLYHDISYDPNNTGSYQCNPQFVCDRWSEDETVCIEHHFEYDTCYYFDPMTNYRGNITKITTYSDVQNMGGAVFEKRSYDVTGNLIKSSTACCEQSSTQFTVDNQYAYPISQTRGAADQNSPYRITTGSVFDKNTGLIKQQTDANGRSSLIMYNPNTLRPVKSISSTGAYSLFDYDESAMSVTEEIRESNGNLAGKSVKYLNGLGLTKRIEDLGSSNVVLSITETKYNKYAEEWKMSRPYKTGETPQWTTKEYDSQGRLKKIVELDQSFSEAFYNHPQFPDAATVQSGNVLPPGNTIIVADPWGRQRWGRYDQQGRLVEVVEPNPDRTANPTGSVLAAGSLKTKYKYDTLGRLIETDQDNQLRKFKYDDLGRITRQKLAEQTATLNDTGTYVGEGNANAKWSESFVYDNRSNLIQKIDPRGVKTNFSYQISGADDPLNRIQARTFDLSGPLAPNLTIHATQNVTYEYMTTGDKSRLKKIRTAGILTEEYVYDVESRVSEYKQTVDYRESYPMTVNYLYDTLDRVTEIQYPAQYGLTGSPRKTITNSYDATSRLSSLKVNNTEVAGNFEYDASDQTTSMKIGPAGSNQITEEYTFDQATGLLTNQKAKKGNQTLLDLSYDYNRNNAVGNLNGKTGHLTKVINNLDNNRNREYEFDVLGRLTKAKGGENGNLWTQNYSYDRYGNRTNVTASGVAADNSAIPLDGTPNLSYQAANNRISTEGYQYDSAGNQIRAKGENGTWLLFEYDAANRLVIVKTDGTTPTPIQSFAYSSNNARLFSYDNAAAQLTIFASVSGKTLAEYSEFTHTIPTWTKSNVYMGDSQLSTIMPNGSGGEITEYNHPDRLGSKLMTNQQAGTSYEQSHLPFGKALNGESTGSTNKRFTSYERSTISGLDYAVNRTYDAKQGRFTQVDPIGMQAVSLGNPQTLNLYSYCGNDPINHTDPSGLFFGKLFKWIGKIFRAITVALAVAIAVVAVITMPSLMPILGGTFFAKLFILSGLLFVSAFAPPKISAIVGIATGLFISFAGLSKIGIIVNVAEDANKIDKLIKWFRLTGAVVSIGSVTNSFRAKKETAAERRRRKLIKSAVDSALWRLANKPNCVKFIQEEFTAFDPETVLKSAQVVYDSTLTVAEQANVGIGAFGKIKLGDKWFDDPTIDGWVGTMNRSNTRTVKVLHGLKHLLGTPHDTLPNGTNRDSLYFYKGIANNCFGLNLK